MKTEAKRVTAVRLDEACEKQLEILSARMGCSRSEAMRYAILHCNQLIKSASETLGTIEPSIESIKKEIAIMRAEQKEVMRIPSFFEYRVRGMVSEWPEANGDFLSPDTITLMGKRYATQYGKTPDPADKRQFGRIPEGFDSAGFVKRVAMLINAGVIRGYGDKE